MKLVNLINYIISYIIYLFIYLIDLISQVGLYFGV